MPLAPIRAVRPRRPLVGGPAPRAARPPTPVLVARSAPRPPERGRAVVLRVVTSRPRPARPPLRPSATWRPPGGTAVVLRVRSWPRPPRRVLAPASRPFAFRGVGLGVVLPIPPAIPSTSTRVPFETGLAAYLAAYPAIAALAGARIYRSRIPQRVKDATPCLVYQVVSRIRDQVLEGDHSYGRSARRRFFPCLPVWRAGGCSRVRVPTRPESTNPDRSALLMFAALSACNRIPQEDMGGVDVAAAWIDPSESADDDDLAGGSDSARTRYHFDARIDYRETLD